MSFKASIISIWPQRVFPTFKIYVDQFRIFKNMVSDTLIYCNEDAELKKLCIEKTACALIPYTTPKYSIENGITTIDNTDLLIFGNLIKRYFYYF